MRRYLKQVIAVAAVVAMMGLSAQAYADNTRRSGRERSTQAGEKRHDFIKELNLTPEQQEQLNAQRQNGKQEMEDIRQQMQAKREELKQELEKPAIDQARIDSIINGMKELMGRQLQNRVAKIVAMKQILTPEQFQQMQTKMQEMKQGWKEGGRKHRGHKGFFAEDTEGEQENNEL